MIRRLLISAVVAFVAVTACGAATAAQPARLTVSFDRGARLGASTALTATLDVDPRLAPSAVTELRLLYPASLGVTTSGLGLEACHRSESDFRKVQIEGSGLGGCAPNSVMGHGSVRAEVHLGTFVTPATANIIVFAGPIRSGSLQILAYVDGINPLGFRLLLGGAVETAPRPFGGALAIRVPAVPDLPDDASVMLTQVRLAIGDRGITYYDTSGGRTVAYHPDGVALPTRCPKGGFRFRGRLSFQDGSTAVVTAAVPCSQLGPAIDPTPGPAR